MLTNYIGKNPNIVNVAISDEYQTNSSDLVASTKCVYNAVQEILSQMLTGDPWSLFPPKIPVVVDGVTFGGSDGRRAIMPGETVAREDWILCDGGSDGKGGTVPDLRGRMIRGASDSVPAGSTGGSETHTHSVSGTVGSSGSHSHTLSGSVGSTTLSVSQMPSHSHRYTTVTTPGSISAGGSGVGTYAIDTGNTGGSSSHSHSDSFSVSSGGSHSHSLNVNSVGGGSVTTVLFTQLYHAYINKHIRLLPNY